MAGTGPELIKSVYVSPTPSGLAGWGGACRRRAQLVSHGVARPLGRAASLRRGIDMRADDEQVVEYLFKATDRSTD